MAFIIALFGAVMFWAGYCTGRESIRIEKYEEQIEREELTSFYNKQERRL